jgi:hypothetical protein
MTGNLGLWRRAGCEMAHTAINYLLTFDSLFGSRPTPSRHYQHVRYWPKADMGLCAAHVRFGV